MLFPLLINHGAPPDETHPAYNHAASCAGFCSACGREHTLAAGLAHAECTALMNLLHAHDTVDMLSAEPDPRLSLDYLRGEARGQMFGVLVCRTPQGAYGTLRAFSGQYNGIWSVPGWVPPIPDVQEFDALVRQDDPPIRELSRRIADLDAAPHPACACTDEYGAEPSGNSAHETRKQLTDQRKALSQQAMRRVFSLYRLRNFRGQCAVLHDILPTGKGAPTGTGDCCAPKLLHYAALHGLTPLGLAEFYWGRENRSGTRQHGSFYTACTEKCGLILGFMLCGLASPAGPKSVIQGTNGADTP